MIYVNQEFPTLVVRVHISACHFLRHPLLVRDQRIENVDGTNQSTDRDIERGRVRAFGGFPLPDKTISQGLKRLEIFCVLGDAVDFGPDPRPVVIQVGV